MCDGKFLPKDNSNGGYSIFWEIKMPKYLVPLLEGMGYYGWKKRKGEKLEGKKKEWYTEMLGGIPHIVLCILSQFFALV